MKKRIRRRASKENYVVVLAAIVLVCFLTVGYAAFQTNISITAKGNILKQSRMIKSWGFESQEEFHNDLYRDKIVTAKFLDTNKVPENAVKTWDVSEKQDGGVKAYIIARDNEVDRYDLFIGAEGGVIANENSSYLFSKFRELLSIDFNDNFDTSNVTNMSYMFRTNVGGDGYMKLQIINFGSTFVTNNVTDMRNMFDGCKDLTELDVSRFNTSKVVSMGYMFSSCQSLEELDVSNFDTSNVTNMYHMFYNCFQLKSLDLTRWNTEKVTNMNSMFMHCRSLQELNLCSFNTKNVENMSGILNGTTNLNKVLVGPNWDITNANTTDMFAVSKISAVTTGQCDI